MKPPKFHRITDYDRALLPNPLLRELESGVTSQKDWMERTGLSPGHPVWGILYHVLIDARLGDSIAVLAEELPRRREINFAYLDGAHTFDHVMGEFALVYPRLAAGAMVVFDNTYEIAEPHEDQRVYGALKEIKQRYGGNIVHIPYVSWYTPGLAIWQQ